MATHITQNTLPNTVVYFINLFRKALTHKINFENLMKKTFGTWPYMRVKVMTAIFDSFFHGFDLQANESEPAEIDKNPRMSHLFYMRYNKKTNM